jgi:hypothetical protein
MLFANPVPVSKKTLNAPGFASGIGLSKLKIGLIPTSASRSYLSH